MKPQPFIRLGIAFCLSLALGLPAAKAAPTPATSAQCMEVAFMLGMSAGYITEKGPRNSEGSDTWKKIPAMKEFMAYMSRGEIDSYQDYLHGTDSWSQWEGEGSYYGYTAQQWNQWYQSFFPKAETFLSPEVAASEMITKLLRHLNLADASVPANSFTIYNSPRNETVNLGSFSSCGFKIEGNRFVFGDNNRCALIRAENDVLRLKCELPKGIAPSQ